MLLAVHRYAEGVHFVRLDAVQRTLASRQVRLKTVHLPRIHHTIDEPLLLKPCTQVLTVQASVFHAEQNAVLVYAKPIQPLAYLDETRLLVVYTDMPMLPVHIHAIVVGQVKPSLRHIHPNEQFSFHTLLPLCFILQKEPRAEGESSYS